MRHYTGGLSKLSMVMISVVLTGCGSFTNHPERAILFEREGSDLILNHQTGEAFSFIENRVGEYVCKSPSPDVVVGASVSFSDSIPVTKLLGGEASGSDEFDTASLGGRSPSVLLAREILYRGCELSANHKLSVDQAIELFENSLEKVVAIAEASSQVAGTAAASSGAEATAPAINSVMSSENGTASSSSMDTTSSSDLFDTTSQ
ncbi:MAG: hypothetical protein EBS77_08505 [Gammaproteobacteria bacterium]|nr:hypothetical protein [Gammaproteobacteria bacterium]